MFFRVRPKFANVQYHGSHYTTQSCLHAIVRLLASNARVSRAILLTHAGRHAFYLDIGDPTPVLIKTGFTSGYEGEGPAGLAIALHLMQRHRFDVEEVEVSRRFLERIDENKLTDADLRLVLEMPVIRPIRTYDYMHGGLRYRGRPEDQMRGQYPSAFPWFVLDERLLDQALELEVDPDKAVSNSFRKLESHVKARCSIEAQFHGVEVFKKAFRGQGARLKWADITTSEAEGRALLFEGAYIAFRNPRAHRDDKDDPVAAFREFLLVNELFRLEAEAEPA